MAKTRCTKRALLLSALSLLMCVSMLAGSTLAWFTDEVTSSGNQIVAGKLDVDLIDANGNSLENETLQFVDKDNNEILTQILWEPGCTYTLEPVKVKNNGNLWLKYEIVISGLKGDAELLEAIEWTIMLGDNEVTLDDLNGYLEPGKTSEALQIIGHMKEEAGNKYQEKSIDGISITVYATQYTKENDSFDDQYDADALVADILATPETAQEIIDNAAEGTVIGLMAGTYDDLIVRNADGSAKNNITLLSNSAVVASVNLNGSTKITLKGLTFDASKGTTVWSYSAPTTSDSGVIASITDASQTRSYYGAQDITIVNCTFEGTPANVASYACIATTRYRSSQSSKNFTIKNCNFACDAQNYLQLNYIYGEVVVENNTFGGGEFSTGHNTINAVGSSANWTIVGNEFNNWNAEKAAIGSSRSSADGIVNWTVTGNNFNNAEDAVAFALKAKSYNANNTAVVFENNTALNGNATLVAAARNAEDDEDIFLGKKIQLDEGVELVNDATALTNVLKNTATDVVVLTNNVTVDTNWDARYTGGKQTKEVVIDGLGNTLKITGQVADNNHNAVFRFETDAVVKNLVIDLSEASGYNGNTARAISAKGSLTVDNCTFIGNPALSKTRAIIFGEGQSAAPYDAEISITNCTFVNWKRGITDNENGADVKTVVIENNTCTNAHIYASAYENITVVNNTMSGSEINITSYSAAATAKVLAQGNVLDENQANMIGSASKQFTAANVDCQEGFVVNTIA